MVLAGLWSNLFLIATAVAALWSLWWIVRGALTNVSEREEEDAARARVAEGGGWDPDGPAPRPFSDAELRELSEALEPQSLEEAGVSARPRERKRSRSNKRP